MFVRIKRLRQGGREIPEPEASRPEHTTAGDLIAMGTRYELHQPLSNRGAVEVLYDGRVVSIRQGVGGMLIRGFEEHQGRGVLQEWEVQPLDQRVGPSGRLTWNWPEPR